MKQFLLILLTLIPIYIFAQSTSWNEAKLKEHWKTNGADEIEGIYIKSRKVIQYNAVGNAKTYNFISGEDFFIVKQNNKLIVASFSDDFYGTITKAVGSNKYFLSTNLDYWGISNQKKTLSMHLNNSKELEIEDIVYFEELKVHGVNISRKNVWQETFSLVYKPGVVIKSNFSPEEIKKSNLKTSGTGFAISPNGIIATNYHVIGDSKKITVKGVNANFNKSFKAKIVVSDKLNDLALIQIDDYSFTSLEAIPYILKTNLVNAGEDIFALGYPLRAVMGDEIKLTNGIISSKTGFQGDITSYQVSAPVQPGNSGGPLFDYNGNVIGIISAKVSKAENVSYAIKSNYLINLIELLSSPPVLPTVSKLKGKSLSSQVEIVNKFIYIIEAE